MCIRFDLQWFPKLTACLRLSLEDLCSPFMEIIFGTVPASGPLGNSNENQQRTCNEAERRRWRPKLHCKWDDDQSSLWSGWWPKVWIAVCLRWCVERLSMNRGMFGVFNWPNRTKWCDDTWLLAPIARIVYGFWILIGSFCDLCSMRWHITFDFGSFMAFVRKTALFSCQRDLCCGFWWTTAVKSAPVTRDLFRADIFLVSRAALSLKRNKGC